MNERGDEMSEGREKGMGEKDNKGKVQNFKGRKTTRRKAKKERRK